MNTIFKRHRFYFLLSNLILTWTRTVTLTLTLTRTRTLPAPFLFIFLNCPQHPPISGFVGSYEAAIDIPTEAPNLASMSLIFLLRSILYFTAALIASTSVLLSSLSNEEKVVITGLLALGLLSFEVTGTFVGPPTTDIVGIGIGDNIKPDIVSGVSGSSSSGGVDGSTDTPDRSSRLGARASTSASGATSNVAYCRGPSLTCVAILDMPSTADIGPMLLPTVAYPSDHITIAADLALIW